MDVIQQNFSDPGIANFVATNLVYDEASDRKFVKWCVNLESIIANLESLVGFDPALKPFTKPSLFINGALSVKVDEQLYRKAFPECKILSIEGAGHYVHTDKPKLTLEAIALFLESVEK